MRSLFTSPLKCNCMQSDDMSPSFCYRAKLKKHNHTSTNAILSQNNKLQSHSHLAQSFCPRLSPQSGKVEFSLTLNLQPFFAQPFASFIIQLYYKTCKKALWLWVFILHWISSYSQPREGVIIECPQNGLFHNLVTVILTPQTAISEMINHDHMTFFH